MSSKRTARPVVKDDDELSTFGDGEATIAVADDAAHSWNGDSTLATDEPFQDATPAQVAPTRNRSASATVEDDSGFEEATPFGQSGFDDSEATAMEAGDAKSAPMPRVVSRAASQARPRVGGALATDPPEAPERATEPPPAVIRKNQTEAEFSSRFTVGPPVGSGGMAEVRLGYERLDDGDVRPCVIKRIAREYAKQAKYREMFTEEVRLSRLLDHPNVVRAYSDGEVDSVPYIVFELIDGVTLKDFQRLAGEPIPAAVAAEIAIEVTNGLAYAHNAMGEDGEPMKLVHRDVSPQNILISRNLDVKLVDFGIARFEGRMHSTMSGEVKGKMKYMALEQLAEKPVDGRADIFALGIVIAEVLGILKEGFTEHFVSGLEDQPRHVPKPLYDLLKKMTAPKAENRPANAEVLLAELVRVHAQLPKVKLEEFGRRSVFSKHKSILEKGGAPPKAAPAPTAPKKPPKAAVNPETDFDGGGEFDEDAEATIGYAEFLQAGHMPQLPGQQAGVVEDREPEAEDEPTPPPEEPPPRPTSARQEPKRALVEPTSRVRIRKELSDPEPEVRGVSPSAAPRGASVSASVKPRGTSGGTPTPQARGSSGGTPSPVARGSSAGSPSPAPRGTSGGTPLPVPRGTSGGAPSPLRPQVPQQRPGQMPMNPSMSMPGMQAPGMGGFTGPGVPMPGMPPGMGGITGMQMHPGMGGLSPEMLAEMSRRSGLMPQPKSDNKIIWIIAAILTALALVFLGVAVALKLRPAAPTTLPAETIQQPQK